MKPISPLNNQRTSFCFHYLLPVKDEWTAEIWYMIFQSIHAQEVVEI